MCIVVFVHLHSALELVGIKISDVQQIRPDISHTEVVLSPKTIMAITIDFRVGSAQRSKG